MNVAITGAAGDVGRVVSEAFDPDERHLFTHREHDDVESSILDVTDRDAFVDALDGPDTLIHLAWLPAGEESWDDGHGDNVGATFNAFEAARRNDVDRVVFASSNHAVGMYNRDEPDEMESVVSDPETTVRPETPVRPDSYYGVAKVACEAMGAFYAERYGLEVVALRIGWLMSREELREKRAERPARRRFARAMWLSHSDCRSLFDAAVRSQLPESPIVANGISNNSDRYFTLTEAQLGLGYRPDDDASAVIDEE